ncbi:TPA: hypothetical protein ACH7GP_005481, partial [Escherichia coli]
SHRALSEHKTLSISWSHYLTRDKIPFYMLSKNSINRYSDMSDFIQSNNETTPEKAFIKEVMGTGD